LLFFALDLSKYDTSSIVTFLHALCFLPPQSMHYLSPHRRALWLHLGLTHSWAIVWPEGHFIDCSFGRISASIITIFPLSNYWSILPIEFYIDSVL